MENKQDIPSDGVPVALLSVTEETSPRKEEATSTLSIPFVRFTTEQLKCRLQEGKAKSFWLVAPSSTPDCDERNSWPWQVGRFREHHFASPNVLNILGKENPQASVIELRFHVPELAAAWTPPAVVLNEMSGFVLPRKKWIWKGIV